MKTTKATNSTSELRKLREELKRLQVEDGLARDRAIRLNNTNERLLAENLELRKKLAHTEDALTKVLGGSLKNGDAEAKLEMNRNGRIVERLIDAAIERVAGRRK